MMALMREMMAVILPLVSHNHALSNMLPVGIVPVSLLTTEQLQIE